MAIGQLLHAGGTGSPTPYFTPWMGRGGNSAVFVADIIAWNLASGGGRKVKITVQTKNSEDDDSTVTIMGTFADIAGPSLPTTPPTLYCSGALELVRYKIEVYGDAGSEWVQMRMLSPSWLRN